LSRKLQIVVVTLGFVWRVGGIVRLKTVSGMILTMLLMGILTLVLNVQSVGVGETIRVSCMPSLVSLEDPAPQDFRVTLKLPPSSGYKPEDIDSATVRVEEIISIKPVPDSPKITKIFFEFKVDGSEVLNLVIWPKIWYIAPSPGTQVKVPLTVLGQFYNGTAFQGTFDMKVKVKHSSPPPPPS